MIEKVKINSTLIKDTKLDKQKRLYISKDFFCSNLVLQGRSAVVLSLFEDGFFISSNFFQDATDIVVQTLTDNRRIAIPRKWIKLLSLSENGRIIMYKLSNGLFISNK